MTRKVFLKAALAVIVVLGLLAFPGDLAAQGNSGAAFDRVKEVQARHTAGLMARTGVVGTAIGLGQGGRPIMLVLLEKGGVAIPASLDGVQVRPLVTGKIYIFPKPEGKGKPGGGGGGEDPPDVDPTSRFDRPVPIGVSTGHTAVTAGTIGCRVIDGEGNIYALSNNHVYANQNNANLGDAVIQPGTYDGGASPADDIGNLVDFETINFSGNNIMDAAIALSSPGDLGNATPSDGYGTPKSETIDAYVNQKVKKYGRTTGLTKGQVYAINATVNVGYSYAALSVAVFTGQIIITPGSFSAGGDSGSLIVVDGKGRDKADDRKPVGLLFAGSSSFTIANPIDAVLTRFGVTIDGD